MRKAYVIALLLLPLLSMGQDVVSLDDAKRPKLESFKMYPNPAYGEEVYITTASNGKKKIRVFDVFGEIVLVANITTNTLDISGLCEGVYVLQITENRKTMTRKLVVK